MVLGLHAASWLLWHMDWHGITPPDHVVPPGALCAARLTELLQNALGAGPLMVADQAAVPATPSFLALQQHPYAADMQGPSWGSYTASAAAAATAGAGSSAYLSPMRTPRGSTRAAGGGGGFLTPRGMAAAGGGGYLTPRGSMASSYPSLAAAGQLTPRRLAAGAGAVGGPMLTPRQARAAADAVRHRDQAARNKALQKEMGRQGCAFKVRGCCVRWVRAKLGIACTSRACINGHKMQGSSDCRTGQKEEVVPPG
jgi:hypothetical protein